MVVIIVFVSYSFTLKYFLASLNIKTVSWGVGGGCKETSSFWPALLFSMVMFSVTLTNLVHPNNII